MGASAYDHRPVSLDRKTLGFVGVLKGTKKQRKKEGKKETKSSKTKRPVLGTSAGLIAGQSIPAFFKVLTMEELTDTSRSSILESAVLAKASIGILAYRQKYGISAHP